MIDNKKISLGVTKLKTLKANNCHETNFDLLHKFDENLVEFASPLIFASKTK